MRVGFLISGSLDTLTGGYIYDRQLVDHLRQKGHSVVEIHFPGRNYWQRLMQSPRSTLSRKLNHPFLDILLEDELDHPALLSLNRRLKYLGGFPIISIVHNLHCCELRAKWQNQMYRWIEKRYLVGVDGFIFNSLTTRQAVESLIGSVLPAVVANPCGNRLPVQISESEIITRARATGPLRILFLANLLRGKGLHVLLAALARLPEKSYFLTVIGDLNMDRPYVRKIKEQIKDYNLNDSVSITGPLNNNELAFKLKESQVLAVPSFYEGYGIAYLEGMGCGLPAIGTTAGAIGEIITHGQDGFLIPPGDSTALARYLRELNEDRKSLAEMSLMALHRFKAHPTWESTGERILNFLESLRSKFC